MKSYECKDAFKAIHKRQIFQGSLTFSESDAKCEFLYRFLDWFDKWKNNNFDTGFCRYRFCSEIVRYCKEELEMSYTLTGKFQTDPLKNRNGVISAT